MRNHFITSCVIFLVGTATWSADPPTPVDREAILAKLKANKVSLGGLAISAKDGGPQIVLGLGENGGEYNNATDETLRLIARLPELERVSIYFGKYTKDGLSALASLPKLKSLQIYKSEVPPDAFVVLPKLKQLKSLSLGDYPVTDEILGYAGQINGLKSFDHTISRITSVGFLKFLNSVENLEQLTLFGDFVDDACMKRIGQMKEIKRFWTDSKRVTNAGWVHLAGLTKLQDLFLSNTNFADNDMCALEGMKDLRYLGLNKTRITDAGMPSLAGLTKLHDLGFESTNVTDKGMAALKGMTELENLYVGMTDVTAKGLALVPRKDRMQMMRAGKGAMTAKQLDEMMQLYPKTQIFDPSGYWTEDRIKAAMKELGKEWPIVPKEKGTPKEPNSQGKAPAKIKVSDQKATNAIGMQFVKIPSGEFLMGTTEEEANRYIEEDKLHQAQCENEKPAHKVLLSRDYFLGKHPVTVAQFRKFVEATGYETNAEVGYNPLRVTVIEGVTVGTWRDPDFKQGDDHPVVCVTTVDAQKFIDWLNKTDKKIPDGWEYRLPTEAEWEYAARGPKGFKYPWGNEWAEGCARPAPEVMLFKLFNPGFLEFRTLPVGSFSPKGDSPFGVSDMTGNVCEWCSDWYQQKYLKEPQTDPLGPTPGSVTRNGLFASPHTMDEESWYGVASGMRSRVCRGSSWYASKAYIRSTQRASHPQGQRSYIGFRVALAPIIPDRKWPAPRPVLPLPGETILAPTKSSWERIAAFKANADVTERLYKEIVAADQMGILVSMEKKPERALHKYYALMEDLAHRCKLSQQSDVEQRPPTVGELGLLLLIGSDPRMPKPYSVENGVLTIKNCVEIMIEEPKPCRMLLRQLLKSWMLLRLPGQKDFTAIAGLYQLKELAPEISALAVAPDTKAPLRFEALSVLINLGGQPELESLAPLFENIEQVPETFFRRKPGWVENRVPQQWRDLALLVMIRVARGETEEYGFSQAKDISMRNRYDMDLAFLNESARKTAFQKWKSRAKKVPPPAPKAEEQKQQAEPKKDMNGPPPLEPLKDVGKLPNLPGKAPVFAIITKVVKTAETYNFLLLFDEVVNTVKIVEDEKGVVKKRTNGSVMTNHDEEKTDRSLKGIVISTGDGKIEIQLYDYRSDPGVVTGWQLAAKGEYKVQLRYRYDRAAVRKDYDEGCKILDEETAPWNRALEVNKKLEVQLTVKWGN